MTRNSYFSRPAETDPYVSNVSYIDIDVHQKFRGGFRLHTFGIFDTQPMLLRLTLIRFTHQCDVTVIVCYPLLSSVCNSPVFADCKFYDFDWLWQMSRIEGYIEPSSLLNSSLSLEHLPVARGQRLWLINNVR